MKYCWVWQLIKTSSIVALNVVANPATGWEAIVTSRGFPAELVSFAKIFIFLIQFLLNTKYTKNSELCLKYPRNCDRLGHLGTCGDTKQ